MPKRELPQKLAEQIDRMAAEFKERLVAMVRFHGVETIDAVCELLDEAGRPVQLDTLVDKLESGGIAMGASGSKGGAAADLKRSISFYTARNNRIRQVGDYIGRAEWPDSKFPS